MIINQITIRCNVTGAERRRLADYVAGFLGCEKKYLGVPSCAYQVGYITVSRDGAITFDDRADSEKIETLLEELEREGFHAEPVSIPTEGTEQVDESETRSDIPRAACEAGNNCTGNICSMKSQTPHRTRLLPHKPRPRLMMPRSVLQ